MPPQLPGALQPPIGAPLVNAQTSELFQQWQLQQQIALFQQWQQQQFPQQQFQLQGGGGGGGIGQGNPPTPWMVGPTCKLSARQKAHAGVIIRHTHACAHVRHGSVLVICLS